jgi:homocitrate synthase NifV
LAHPVVAGHAARPHFAPDRGIPLSWILQKLVARESGRAIGSARPIVGEKLFTCETGLHVQGLMVDPQTYEPFVPELIGAKRKLLIGSKTGCRAIAATMKRLSLPGLDDVLLTNLTSRVRRAAHELQRLLADHEIVELATMQPGS